MTAANLYKLVQPFRSQQWFLNILNRHKKSDNVNNQGGEHQTYNYPYHETPFLRSTLYQTLPYPTQKFPSYPSYPCILPPLPYLNMSFHLIPYCTIFYPSLLFCKLHYPTFPSMYPGCMDGQMQRKIMLLSHTLTIREVM